jgi:hypothetical protein
MAAREAFGLRRNAAKCERWLCGRVRPFAGWQAIPMAMTSPLPAAELEAFSVLKLSVESLVGPDFRAPRYSSRHAELEEKSKRGDSRPVGGPALAGNSALALLLEP